MKTGPAGEPVPPDDSQPGDAELADSQPGDSQPGDSGPDDPASKGLARRTIVEAMWSSGGTAAQFVSGVVVTVVLARLLDPADFGIVAVGITVLTLFQTLGYVGIAQAIVRAPTLDRTETEVAFTLCAGCGFVLSAILLATSPAIAKFFDDDQLTPVLRVISLVLLIRGLGVIAEALLQRELRFRRLAGIQAVSFGIVYSATAVVLAVAGFGLWSLVWAQVAQAATETLLFLAARPHSKRLRLRRTIVRRLFSYSTGASLTRIANTIGLNGDNIIVGRYLGVDALGLYSRAYRLMALPANLMSDAVDAVLVSAMAKVQDTKTRLALAYRRGNGLTAVTAIPVSVVAVVLGPEIVDVLLGSQWRGAIVPFQILALGTFFRTGRKAGTALARATGAVYRLSWTLLWFAALVVAGCYLFRSWGLAGISWAVDLALLVQYVSVARLSSRLLDMRARELVGIVAPGVALGAGVGASTWVAAALTRSWLDSSALVLGVGMATAALTVLVLQRVCPAIVLGADGIWWREQLAGHLGRRGRTRRDSGDHHERG